MKMSTIKYHGAPGTGKTTKTNHEFRNALESGYKPGEILYSTYRREAARDAKSRIAEVTGTEVKSLKRVKTTHGICLSLLAESGEIADVDVEGVGKITPIMKPKDYATFNEECNYDVKLKRKVSDEAYGNKNDPYLTFYGLLKATMTPIASAGEVYDGDGSKHSIAEMKQFCRDYEFWKKTNCKIDFSDMVDIVLQKKLSPECPVQIYDEAQDMTTQLFEVSKMWAKEAELVYLAGDPLQTLYPFWGADPAHFTEWAGETEVLPVSQRLPHNVWQVASDVINLNTSYETPEIETRKDSGWIARMHAENLESWLETNPKNHTSTVFHLGRTSYVCRDVATMLARLGIPFSGIEDYAWNAEQMALYNGIKAVRTGRDLNRFEMCALLDAFPEIYALKSNYGTKEEIKEMLRSRQTIPTLKSLKEEFVMNLRSANPLTHFKPTGLSRLKIEGALVAGVPKITPELLAQVQVLTIHGSKGMEADTVFLHNQITPAVVRSLTTKTGNENEAFVWYVGITRTRRNLIVVDYTGRKYPIPGVCV
jgi:superfamily I DNA/RNA helicase